MVAFWEVAACCVMAVIFGGVALMLALKAVSIFGYLLAGVALVFVSGMGYEFWRRVAAIRGESESESEPQSADRCPERDSCVWWYSDDCDGNADHCPMSLSYWGGDDDESAG
jgi:membrane protein implicated in regulation of membrane protease activity